METPTNVVRRRLPEAIDDPLTGFLRASARRRLAWAVEFRGRCLPAAMQDLRLPDERVRLVRHGHGPARAIQNGIDPVPDARVRVRDRGVGQHRARLKGREPALRGEV